MIFCSVNGVKSHVISTTDRGLMYGDGFFTTSLVINGHQQNPHAHHRRLAESAKRLYFPTLDWKRIDPYIAQAIEATSQLNADEKHFVLKIIITRGSGGKGYLPPEEGDTAIQIIIQTHKTPFKMTLNAKNNLAWSAPLQTAMVCKTAWGLHPILAGLKTLNRLENVLARRECNQALTPFDEGIILDINNQVISGTQSNIVLIEGNQLITPCLSHSGVQGTMLSSLKAWAGLNGFSWIETSFTLARLLAADEVFFCNAVRGIMPIKELDTLRKTAVSQKIHASLMQTIYTNSIP